MADKNIISYLELESGFTGMKDNEPLIWDDQKMVPAGEFYERAEAFAWYLMEKGLWNAPVAIVSEHVPETLELYLGTLLSGNYYVPIAEDWAPQKRQSVLRSIQTNVVYDKSILQGWEWKDERLEERIAQGAGQGKFRQTVREKLRQARKRLPENAPLYLIYTSGSTGEPKGIVKTHENMIVFLEAYLEVFHFRDSDVLANQTPFCFDASAKDIYLMWKKRLPVYMVDAALFLRPKDLVRRLNQHKVSILQWVPSALSMLSQLKSFEKEKPEYLRRVAFVGEVFPVRQLAYWQSRLPSCEFYNLYGASELAGICCYYRVANAAGYDTLPLGQPLPRQKAYLVRAGRLISEPGEWGEICIQSESLASGYYGSEDAGKQVFVSHLTEELQGGRYYRTGDLGRYDEEGNLCFAGRMDDQIKHMGHRIELGEIEQAALRLEQVERAAAVYEKGRIRLYCQGGVSKAEVMGALRERLSDYMIPQQVEIVEEIPLNAHGKSRKHF